MSSLETMAMIVKLAISNWTARKTDKGLAAKLAVQHGADEQAARVTKRLIGSSHLGEIRKAVRSAKRWHDLLTLPWGDQGERLLPVGMHAQYVENIDRCVDQMEQALKAFLAQYDSLVQEARGHLGDMFDSADYPSREQVARKFRVRYEISPVPSASHFLVDLADEHAERVRADIERRVQAKMDNAVVSLYERVEDGLRRLIDRLGTDEDGKPNRIHATALTTIQELADAVPAMNLTDDRRLAEIGRRIKRALKDVEVKDLRHRSKKAEAVQVVNARRSKLSGELTSIAASYFGDPAEAAKPSRPEPGTKTGRVWELADELGNRDAVMAAGAKEGLNASTIAIQFTRWEQANR